MPDSFAPARAVRCALLAAAAVACASEPPSSQTGPTWHGDIKPIVDAHCASCHTAGGIAPFALTTREQVAASKAAILTDLQQHRMPPFAADSKVRSYRYDDSLSAQQVDLFSKWFAAGAPEGSAAKPGAKIALERPQLSSVQFKFKLPNPFKPAKTGDTYRCFPVDWPHKDAKYVTGFGVLPGNPKIVHHAIMFAIPPGDGFQVDKFDQADPGDGYECYGAPFPAKATINTSFVGEWAPGTDGVDYPKGTGILVEPGTRLVLQMHYNNAADPQGSDQTEVHMALADQVERQAWFLPWFNLTWFLSPETMTVAAGDPKAEQFFEQVPAKSDVAASLMNAADLTDGFLVHAVLPHMHMRGKTLDLNVLRPDASKDPLLSVLNWNFNWQRLYFLASPAKVAKDDKLRIACHWDNSAANQPVINGQKQAPQTVHWGEGSYDEMCLAFLYITLK